MSGLNKNTSEGGEKASIQRTSLLNALQKLIGSPQNEEKQFPCGKILTLRENSRDPRHFYMKIKPCRQKTRQCPCFGCVSPGGVQCLPFPKRGPDLGVGERLLGGRCGRRFTQVRAGRGDLKGSGRWLKGGQIEPRSGRGSLRRALGAKWANANRIPNV